MKHFTINTIEHKNAGIAREWALCGYYGIERSAHDSRAYDKASDIEVGSKHISVKTSGATLMSGSLCEGRDTFEGIWNLYASRVHSNIFAYVTEDFEVYEMSLDEFGEFVHKFGRTERESSKNGGAMKIRLRKESAIMREWLARA